MNSSFSPTLPQTLRHLATQTFATLAKARYLGHQPLEETFTDINLLELKHLHPRDIVCKTFNKREEGRTGADWEWWLTDATGSEWLGMRVQAKVLHLLSNSFPHLHYKSGMAYQTSKLQAAAAQDGLLPMYCLFVDSPSPGAFRTMDSVETYGCSLATAEHVEALRRAGKATDLKRVMEQAMPWHWMVSLEPNPKWSSDTTRLRALSNLLRQRVKLRRRMDFAEEIFDRRPSPGVRSRPPDYVTTLWETGGIEEFRKDLGGVLIIRDDRPSR